METMHKSESSISSALPPLSSPINSSNTTVSVDQSHPTAHFVSPAVPFAHSPKPEVTKLSTSIISTANTHYPEKAFLSIRCPSPKPPHRAHCTLYKPPLLPTPIHPLPPLGLFPQVHGTRGLSQPPLGLKQGSPHKVTGLQTEHPPPPLSYPTILSVHTISPREPSSQPRLALCLLGLLSSLLTPHIAHPPSYQHYP